jgi:hypothetical protein
MLSNLEINTLLANCTLMLSEVVIGSFVHCISKVASSDNTMKLAIIA